MQKTIVNNNTTQGTRKVVRSIVNRKVTIPQDNLHKWLDTAIDFLTTQTRDECFLKWTTEQEEQGTQGTTLHTTFPATIELGEQGTQGTPLQISCHRSMN